jgi:hypothetical protein
MLEIPSAAMLKAYETLGIVAILLGVLFVFFGAVVVVAWWVGNNVSSFAKGFASRHLAEMESQSHTMVRMETKQDHLIRTQEAWNSYLFCWLPHCPIKQLKKTHENERKEHIPVQNASNEPGPGTGTPGTAGA